MNFDKLYKIIFVLCLFFVGFNQIELLPFLGEYKRDTSMLFILIGFLVLCLETLKTRRLYYPYKTIYITLFLLFTLWCILSTLLNIGTIKDNYFKRTTGIERFIRQFISLAIIVCVVLPFVWRVIKDFTLSDILKYIRGTMLVSLVFATIYGVFDIAYNYFGIYPAYLILENIFDYLPFINPYYHDKRISIFAYEPPYLAIYLLSIAGWMFSYLITARNLLLRFLPSITIIILTFFSGSRTALIVIFLQLFIFLFILYKDNFYRKEIKIILAGCMLLGFLAVGIYGERLVTAIEQRVESLNFSDNLKKDISNKTRFGMQYASMQVFLEHPIIGVGYGQQAFHSRDFYPIWATKKNWEFSGIYQNKKDSSFPPAFNIFTRIAAELGLIGLILFTFFNASVLFYSYKFTKITKSIDKVYYAVALALFISFIGLIINWLQLDTYRVYIFWINLAILIKFSLLLPIKYKNEKV
ncbi:MULTISPECIES: O-antigen ligase family protein [Weeksella]|uniref:O-antigen polymerase n=2 Tax=Flavobacteriales TaxID=200644 RepID=F0P1Z4_WEEVC|nr:MULTISPECIES: O-antigen ligase family protein [Weeksella]ADX67704.1 O-antigen polymerase [Weeksella virosa DSM 16922]MDK7373996.1 O-antigen ligase family protein [Weeksella virosa]MDK7674251.1 O-antigen ligase family protein [Weeksella virosa]OFM82683.1 hypothetical protein HMPREF2660_03240 [Weeksella sp. HMSC059D05]SUP54003.1 Lipid A core - O-antigen ligase and related enzymes [Weeksella virosa]